MTPTLCLPSHSHGEESERENAEAVVVCCCCCCFHLEDGESVYKAEEEEEEASEVAGTISEEGTYTLEHSCSGNQPCSPGKELLSCAGDKVACRLL